MFLSLTQLKRNKFFCADYINHGGIITIMKRKSGWILCFALLAALLLAALAGAADRTVRAVVLYDEDADASALTAMLEGMEDVCVLWRYDSLFAGAAVETSSARLAELEALPGVEAARTVRSYVPAASGGADEELPFEESLALMGVDKLWEQGYTGDGTVIAVLDSGLLTSHEVFADDSLVTAPAISREDVADFAAKGRTAGRYISRRIPFAYDYYSKDDDVTTTNGHGTHVTALAAGYAVDGRGDVKFRGAAPGAQILSMKVFPNGSSGGTDDAVILRALEDAWNLGADVVNLSVATGAGFRQDDALDGTYSRAFAQMAESGVIICCATGNSNTTSAEKSWLAKLPGGGYTDYSSVCSPASYEGSVAIAAAGQDEKTGKAVMAEYSSWGPASGLHFAPALTVFGGPSVSASASGEDMYRNDTGTSMASGSASGMFAVLLQSLRQEGVTDRAQAARLARSLLESTAQVLTDGQGVPLSPRKQGAGLASLEAAASSKLAVLDPLLEPGESQEGNFTLRLTLYNRSDKALTASVNVQTLTDHYESQNGRVYSLLTPRDITRDVTVSGSRSVNVPARGEAAVTLELTVGAQLRRELEEAFPNGFYVEGFVTASAGGEKAHAAFLGYCGDWEAAPILEPLDFRDIQDAAWRLTQGDGAQPEREACLEALGAELGANLAYLTNDALDEEAQRLLGSSPYSAALHDDGRSAIPSRDTDAMTTQGSLLCLDLYALRSAAGIVALVWNPETGEIYYAGDETWAEKSILDIYGESIVPAVQFSWDGTDASGQGVAAGTRVQVDVYAWLDTDSEPREAYRKNHHRGRPEEYRWLLEEGFDGYRELSFPVVLDGAAPTVSAALSDGGQTLTLTFRDDQYVAYAVVGDENRWLLGEEAFVPTRAGEACTLRVDLSGYDQLPETVYIQVEDYASNAVGYALDLGDLASGGKGELQRCAALLLEDVGFNDWYHAAADFAVGSGILPANEDGKFQPEKAATRAEIVSALYRANGSRPGKLTAKDLPFSDVPGYASYTQALCWAYELGIAGGRDDGTFGGSSSVTRQELAVMLYRCDQLAGQAGASGSLAGFPDAGSVAGWAREAMTWAVGRGIIAGDAAGRLSPEGKVTRAETAQMLMRYING